MIKLIQGQSEIDRRGIKQFYPNNDICEAFFGAGGLK
jgi:hypothetical protein